MRATRYFLPLVLTLICYISQAQKTVVSGKVYNADTHEPLPFVNLVFKGTKTGTATDMNGNFHIETYYASDSLICTAVAYGRMAKKIRKDRSQYIEFPMHEQSIELNTVVVHAARKIKDPAIELMKKAMKNKKINNREKLDSYEYEVYNRVEFDLNNIDEKFTKRRVFKPFQFVFDNIDSTEDKPFLPLFMTENISKYFYRKAPRLQKELITASQVSGVENESVTQFLGDMYQNLNVYDNYVHAFNKNFMSPMSTLGFATYHYYLLDSAYLDGCWCYKIRFKPKRKHELTFDGEMWINDTTYAVKEISCTISGDANINWISDFTVHQVFAQVEPEVWMLTKDELIVDFELTDKSLGFYGRKLSTYKDFVINKPRDEKFFSGPENIIISDSANSRDDAYWKEKRHVNLTENQEKIFELIDTIRKVPVFRTYVDIITLFVTGYKVWKKVEIGPYFTMYSFNKVEGQRFRFGGRTSNDFSTRLMIEGYGAYGTRDQAFKYSGGFNYFISKKPRLRIGVYYKHDLEQLGQSDEAWRQDNILSSVFRRNPSTKLNGFDEYKIWLDREWFQGFSNRIQCQYRTIWPEGDLSFTYNLPDGTPTDKKTITTAELSLSTRFAYKEKYVNGEFERISLGTKWPTFMVKADFGIKGIIDSEYEYQRLTLGMSDKIHISTLGYSIVNAKVGKIWGKVPYPLLELHTGNETYFYDNTAFNLMNYYEFVSDQYASASLTHHFNGLFLNHIPLMRRLKWREVVTGQIVYGTLNPETKTLMNFPFTLSSLEKPYMEAGVGVENIFKILRLDAIWRLSYVDDAYISRYESLSRSTITKWGIRAALQINF